MAKITLRRCVACRVSSQKSELIRVVPGEHGDLRLDVENVLPGRGAYIHARPQCWRGAQDSSRWEHALKLPKGSLGGEAFKCFIELLGERLIGTDALDAPLRQERGRKLRL